MALIPRPRNTATGYFDWEYYYIRGGEECEICTNRKPRPEYDHFHCRTCHINLEIPSAGNIGHKLKLHYRNNPEKDPVRGKVTVAHDLLNPPRQVGTTFESLTAHEKTLVREGTKNYFPIFGLFTFMISGIISFHGSVHGNSFRSHNCLTHIIRQVIDPQFSNTATKTAAIDKGVFAKLAKDKLRNDLNAANFLTIGFDGSTIQNHHLLPIFAFYFDRKLGPQLRLLNIVDLKRETGAFVAWAIKRTIEIHGIPKDKIVAIVADNCPTNYGSVNRGGNNNVYAHLKATFGEDLFGVGCLAHILNNALKTIIESIDFGGVKFSTFFSQIHRYFEREVNRTERMLRLMIAMSIDPANTKDKKPTSSFCHTRWLTTLKAVEAVLMNFDAFYIYFIQETEGKHVPEFKSFLTAEFTFHWLAIIRSISVLFENAITAMEGNGILLLDGIKIFEELKAKVWFG